MRVSLIRATVIAVVVTALEVPAFGGQTGNPPARAMELYRQARDFLAKGNRAEAIEALEDAIRLDFELVEAHHDYLSNQKSKAAMLVGRYEDYVKADPNNALLHYLLGKAHANAGRGKDADAQFQKCLEIDREFSWALAELGRQSLKKHDQKRAAELFEKARKRAGRSAALHQTLAVSLSAVHHDGSAVQEAKIALELDPNLFEAYPVKWQAELSNTLGSAKTQAVIMREARRLEASHSQNVDVLYAAHEGYSAIFDAAGVKRTENAIRDIDPDYFKRLGGVRIFTIKANGEELVFSGALAAELTRAQVLSDPKTRLAALKKLEEKIDDPDINLYLIYPAEIPAYIKVGDLESAERLYERIEKAGAAARFRHLRVDLANTYVDHQTKFGTAQDYLSEAIKSGRENLSAVEQSQNASRGATEARNSLAQALHVQGRLFISQGLTEKAIEAFAESVKVAEREGNTLDFGLAYIKINRLNDAIEQLVAAYSFEGSRKQEARAALEKVYGDREPAKPLETLLGEAVAHRKARILEASKTADEGRKIGLEGKPAPSFELHTVKGRLARLSDYQGKVLLLNLWATWCGPCRVEFPALQRIQREYKDRGVVVVMVSIDEEPYLVQMYLQRNPASAVVLVGGDKVEKAFAVQGIPVTLIVDQQGIVRKRFEGFEAGMEQGLRQAIDQLLAGVSSNRKASD
ncbi:MAG TPA: redoxin family protein [Blastocatellia bacterium]|nr:redoxin family protein [Blastocatellia bacterium]